MFGSASRGRLGKYYPAYHCNKRGHYFRVTKDDFDETIKKFVEGIQIAPDYVEALANAVVTEWDNRQAELHKDDANIEARIGELKAHASVTVSKIKFLTSEVAIKYMEEELIKTESEIVVLTAEKEKVSSEQPTDISTVMEYVKYFLEHLEYLLLQQINPVAKAGFFSVLFDKAPTYQEILSGTANLAPFIDLNRVFVQKIMI